MFKSRQEAGQKLVDKLIEQELVIFPERTVVLGITRGGVILASQVASYFKTALDVIIVKKLSAPQDPELAIGAIGETKGSQYLDDRVLQGLNISDTYLQREIETKLQEIKRREAVYRRGRPPVSLKDKDVVVVDDGTATGATMIAACREVWNNEPRRVMAALPVAPLDTLEKLETEADSVIVLETPEPFFAVGQFYQDFPQLTDEEVTELLESNEVTT